MCGGRGVGRGIGGNGVGRGVGRGIGGRGDGRGVGRGRVRGVVREEGRNHILGGALAREVSGATKVNDVGARHGGIGAVSGRGGWFFGSFGRFRFGGRFIGKGIEDVKFEGGEFGVKESWVEVKFGRKHIYVFFLNLIVIFTHSFLPYFFHLSHYLTHTFIHTHPFLLLFLFVL